jgi:glycosyltransferase involved in cell wall biosynthesis
VIVIDQTPLSKRRPELYNEFPDLPLKVIFLDQPGQCASRNAGLNRVSGEYVLFIDDDDEVKPDLIESHLQHLNKTGAEVSSGVAHEMGAGDLPNDFRYARMSDVFPTNNSLIRHRLLRKSGLFDIAYDHGARADADLGMRMYLSGALMLLDPSISVLHHHASRGGLRTHKARVVTYASSRANLFQRNIPSATEIYLAHRYFHRRQAAEFLWLAVFSSLILTGSVGRRALKVVIGLLLLPATLLQLYRNLQRADDLARKYPIIPEL